MILLTAREKQSGFTLIELMIVVAVMGVLAAIALPSYEEQVAKGRRASAKAVLVEAQAWMERFYSENYRYDKNLQDVALDSAGLFPAYFSTAPRAGDGPPAYNMTVTFTANAYTLTAVPLRANDRCGTYSITHRGRKSVVGYTSVAGANVLEASRNCWK
jgi:type IV pilus assembly protein PilE